MTKYLLSFQTVFRLNENIKWLEEFLIYYIHIGFDHFYLYDNDGSISDFTQLGQPASSSFGTNKRGDKIVNAQQAEDKRLLDKIMKKYPGKITYTKWQPLDQNNNITYGQDYATMDFIKKYSHETEWVALMDLDEFLFSENDINIRDYFQNLPSTVSCVFLGQKPFINRFNTNQPLVSQDFRCGSYVHPGGGGSKNIVRTSDFVDLQTLRSINSAEFEMDRVLKNQQLVDIDRTWHLHIHNIAVTNEKIQPDQKDLRFHHCNVKDENALHDIDDGMKRYKFLFDDNGELLEPFIMQNKLYDLQLNHLYNGIVVLVGLLLIAYNQHSIEYYYNYWVNWMKRCLNKKR